MEKLGRRNWWLGSSLHKWYSEMELPCKVDLLIRYISTINDIRYVFSALRWPNGRQFSLARSLENEGYQTVISHWTRWAWSKRYPLPTWSLSGAQSHRNDRSGFRNIQPRFPFNIMIWITPHEFHFNLNMFWITESRMWCRNVYCSLSWFMNICNQ